jgi:hypothetical protein
LSFTSSIAAAVFVTISWAPECRFGTALAPAGLDELAPRLPPDLSLVDGLGLMTPNTKTPTHTHAPCVRPVQDDPNGEATRFGLNPS